MQIVIQQVESKLYLRKLDDWVSDLKQAQLFEDEKKAEDFCKRNHLKDVVIVVIY